MSLKYIELSQKMYRFVAEIYHLSIHCTYAVDLHIYFFLSEGALRYIIITYKRSVKTLERLYGCTGSSESSLYADESIPLNR